MSAWHPIAEGFPNGVGSEGGQVRLDEEHPLGARVTLEEGGATAPWAITCGIYGAMCHTIFLGSEDEGRAAVARVKAHLEAILAMSGEADDAFYAAITRFVDTF
ncbi:MAG: hypothetical protein HOO96_09790 [Polyangiaceae bacterium]|nr:hypothetical protein [Polyangiaceae bacterium]